MAQHIFFLHGALGFPLLSTLYDLIDTCQGAITRDRTRSTQHFHNVWRVRCYFSEFWYQTYIRNYLRLFYAEVLEMLIISRLALNLISALTTDIIFAYFLPSFHHHVRHHLNIDHTRYLCHHERVHQRWSFDSSHTAASIPSSPPYFLRHLQFCERYPSHPSCRTLSPLCSTAYEKHMQSKICWWVCRAINALRFSSYTNGAGCSVWWFRFGGSCPTEKWSCYYPLRNKRQNDISPAQQIMPRLASRDRWIC